MKKFLMLALALAFATSAIAAPGKVKARYSGVVDKYDVASKTLTVKKGDKEGVFVITDTSEVMKGGAKADASALAPGQKVDVEFVLDGATKMIQKVKVSGK